jgi:hypothetical protein
MEDSAVRSWDSGQGKRLEVVHMLVDPVLQGSFRVLNFVVPYFK